MGTKINYVITKGNVSEQLKYSLFKLLDLKICNAIRITHDLDKRFLLISDCPQVLRSSLYKRFGGACSMMSWGGRDDKIDVFEVIRFVSKWVEEQE